MRELIQIDDIHIEEIQSSFTLSPATPEPHRQVESASADNNNNNESLQCPVVARGSKLKPRVVHFYNHGKCGIDLSDQMASYATSLRKGVKWYRKLATEFLLGISIVNSWIVYKAATHRKIKIRQFRLKIASYLLGIPLTGHSVTVSAKQHFFEKQIDRKYCSACYTQKIDLGREKARKHVKKTFYMCKSCPERPRFCHECFVAVHNPK